MRSPPRYSVVVNRPWTIVSIGEASLAQTATGDRPCGLACDVALAACKLGLRGVPVSRVGQDRSGELIVQALRQAGVETAHLQFDPDFPTARLTRRSGAGTTDIAYDPRAAFDQIQWDFDLEDLAQQADAAVYGLIGRRNGQSRSTIDRFLSACPHALRMLDLSHAAPDADRTLVLRALEFAHVLLAPAGSPHLPASLRAMEPEHAAAALVRDFRLRAAMVLAMDGALAFAGPEAPSSSIRVGPLDGVVIPPLMAALAGRLLDATSLDEAMHAAAAVATHIRDRPDVPLPAELLNRPAA
jgi:sugar/nucleoside kinase (ribokinase family)